MLDNEPSQSCHQPEPNDCGALPDYTGYLHAISCDDGDDSGGDCNGVRDYLKVTVPVASNQYLRFYLINTGVVFRDAFGNVVVHNLVGDPDEWTAPADPDCEGL